MAETITRQLREPFVESAGLGITDRGLQLLKDPIPKAPNTPNTCLLYTSPSPRDRTRSRMPSSA